MQRPLLKYTDTELAAEFNAGNPAAFSEIYERCWPRLFRHARRMLKDDDRAADAVQDIFMKLLQRRATFELRESMTAFLSKSLRHLIISQIRHEQVKGKYIERMMNSGDCYTIETDEGMITKELERLINREIDLLPPRTQEIFRLSREQDLNYRQIAAHTGSSEGTVKKQVYNALKILRKKITILITFVLGA